MPRNKQFKKISKLFDTSSEVFMLIALVALFVLPILVAKNMEPVVRTSYEAQKEAYASQIASEAKLAMMQAEQELKSQTAQGESDVLGATSQDNNLMNIVVENKSGIEFFNDNSSLLTENGYSVTVGTSRKFGKIELFTLKNPTSTTLKLNLSALVNGDKKVKSNTDKHLIIGDKDYVLDDSNPMPIELLISPSEETKIYIQSSVTSPSNITVEVKVGE